ncbi:hypothetical protein D3C78_643970 [compost metagenome]
MQVEPHPFVRLDLNLQVVGFELFDLGVTKLRIGRRLEADGDFGVTYAHALAGTQVERHAHPTPIVDHYLQGHIGLGLAGRIHPWLLPVPGQFLAAQLASGVLPAYGVLQGHGLRPGSDGTDYLGLFTAHGIGAEGRWRLHGDHRQELEQVVGHHVAQGTGVVIKRAATLHADRFSGGDLYMIDVMVVPEGFEQAVGKTADQDVLHRLLAQVMVDTIDLFFVHDFEQAGIERLGAGQVRAKGFFHYHAAKAGAFIQ